MLRIFTGLITFILFAAYIGGFVFSVIYGAPLWIISLGALLGFYIGWSIAGGVVFSPFSYFVMSDWSIFKKKVKYAFGVSIVGGIIGLLIAGALGY